nr:serine-rich adhesin for platelets-like isoform X4 [Procambarus clarkii]
MPVLRARSPRVEGGRCYPRVCWTAVNRATHWGVAAHRSPSPDGDLVLPHLCARAVTCNSWPVCTLARNTRLAPLPRYPGNPGAVYTHPGHCHQNECLVNHPSRNLKMRANFDNNSVSQLKQISNKNPIKGASGGFFACDKAEQLASGHHIVSYNSLYSGSDDHSTSDASSDTHSSRDTLSASETVSANENLSACSCSDEDDTYTGLEHCEDLSVDVGCNLVSTVSVTSGAKSIKSAVIVPTMEAVGQRYKLPRCSDGRGGTVAQAAEMNGTCHRRRSPTTYIHSHTSLNVGTEQNHKNELQQYSACDESRYNTVPYKNIRKQTKSSTQRCGGTSKADIATNAQAPPVLRQTTFTVTREHISCAPSTDLTPDSDQGLATCRRGHRNSYTHPSKADAPVASSRRASRPVPDNGVESLIRLVSPATQGAALNTPHLLATTPSTHRNKQNLTPTFPLYRRKMCKSEGSVGTPEGEEVGGGRGRQCSRPGDWRQLPVDKGQRGSGSSKRGGAPVSRSNTTSQDHDNLHTQHKKEEQSPQSQQHRGRAMKISVREEATKKTATLATTLTRTRSGSRSSGGASPATLHSRVPYKTATVAPAPTKLSNKTNSLNRFGFRTSAQVKSGDSTDSVNSILSDAQTISDSNSNIFDLCDNDTENNKSTKKNSDSVSCNTVCIETPRRLESPSVKLNKSPNLNNTPKLGSGLESGRLTAFTRQLPKPQVVTVKSVSPKIQAPRSHSPMLNSPVPHSPMSNTIKSLSPSVRDRGKSPLVKSPLQTSSKTYIDQTSKTKQQSVGNSQHLPRVSRDSESSTRSTTEADSGLGSSSESDKIQGDGETDTLISCHVESTEDVSDAWLREKLKAQESVKRRSGSIEVCFNGTGEFELKRHSLEMKGAGVTVAGSPAAKSESVAEKKPKTSKEKREGTITYGMARQKFAPYSRNRYGYGYQTTSGRSGDSSSSNSSSSPTSNVTKIPGSSGLVRSRVASLEITPNKKPQQTPVLRRTNLKKPIIRPTSLEKTPLLVMPVTEKTVELSKPVCRRLEYSECKVLKSDTLKDSNSEIHQGLNPKLSTPKTMTGDILIVGSVETEMHQDTNIVKETENHGSYYENSYCKMINIDKDDIPFENDTSSDLTSSFSKASQDMHETEKLMIEESNGDFSQSTDAADTSNDVTDCSFSDKLEDTLEGGDSNKHIPHTPDDVGMIALTPQSESSFEILESLSEAIDLTIDDIKDDPEYSITEAESGHDGKAAILETKRESDVDSAASLSGSSISLSTEGTAKPSVMQKPKQVVTAFESQNVPSDFNSLPELPSQAQNSKIESVQKLPVESPIEKKPLSQIASVMKSSFESKSSLELSTELQKSTGMVNVMVESGDRSTLSGMCTPTLNAGRGDLDQDFLIDDEIADQPGLMFGESTMASSFFTDDGIFDDMTSPSPSHAALKSALADMGRSRADSVDTTSSLGADDLMLDFDSEEIKAGGLSNRSSNSSSLSVSLPGTLTGARPKKMHLRITIPGRRYDDDVLSPDANEIFSEWTAMMAEMGGTLSDRCVSRDGSSCGGRASRPRVGSASEISSPDPRRPTVLRPPRQGGVSEVEGGGVCIDRTSYHYMCQDVTALKTMLLRLRRVLQAAETINPFDANLRNSLYLSLASSDLPGGTGINGDKDLITPSVTEVSQENVDLRRQVVLLQQQLDERDRTIRLLQQQLAQSIGNQHPTCTSQEIKDSQNTVNAATQTDRSARPTLTGSSLSRAASIDDGLGPTVSSEVECDHMGRDRSTFAPDQHQPRATSQLPTTFSYQPSNTET